MLSHSLREKTCNYYNFGLKGASGSGLILDFDKVREDLEPLNTAKGKMINDVIENIDSVKNLKDDKQSEDVESRDGPFLPVL